MGGLTGSWSGLAKTNGDEFHYFYNSSPFSSENVK
jgi:hypothetical protein